MSRLDIWDTARYHRPDASALCRGPAINVLLTCLGCTDRTFLPAELRHRAGFPLRIIGADTNWQVYRPTGIDHFEWVPSTTVATYSRYVEHLLRRFAVDLVVPALDQELQKIVSHTGWPASTRFVMPTRDPDDVSLLTNKAQLYAHLRHTELVTHVPHHECVSITHTGMLLGWVRRELDRRGCCVSKPVTGFGSAGFHVVVPHRDDWKALHMRPDRFVSYDQYTNWIERAAKVGFDARLLVSEFLEGPSYSVDVFTEGAVVQMCAAHCRMGKEWGFMDRAIVTDDHGPIRALAAWLGGHFNLHGPWNFEVNYAGGTWKIVEVNPRLSDTATITSWATGGAYLRQILQQVDGKPIESATVRPLRYDQRPTPYVTESV